MRLIALIFFTVSGGYEPAPWSTVVIGGNLYMWAGWVRALHMIAVHNSPEKRAFVSSAYVFHLDRLGTIGTPPLGVHGYACRSAAGGDELWWLLWSW